MTLIMKNVAIAIHNQQLVRPFSLAIAPGEIVTLMGASGSGKSTILSYVGGDIDPAFRASGDLILNGRVLNNIPPEQRAIGRLFQDDLLFPHMTVGENLAFACARQPRSKRDNLVGLALHRAGLDGFAHRPPHTLSGGQRMRVSLMRALLAEPEAILLDEPFSKLDKDLRATMRDYVFSHISARNIPALMVTHDASDAITGSKILTIINSEVRNV
jgi:putative thiamine transport system ATP-binding protein